MAAPARSTSCYTDPARKPFCLAAGSALDMSAKLEAHRRKQFVGEIACPRESKRWKSAELSTGTGAPSSIAAEIVQRPSPESETRPENFSSVG